MFASNIFLGLVKVLVFVYGLISMPFYFAYYKLWSTRRTTVNRARVVSTGPNEITYTATPYPCR
jgi:hypothetical protein